MKEDALSVILIIISAILTASLTTFSSLFLILTLPGLLFGLALTIPIIHPNYRSNKTSLSIVVIYPAIWVISLALSFMLQLGTPNISDKAPYIISGLTSGVLIAIVFDWQFGLKNRYIGLVTISVLSIVAVLLGDYFFPNPHEKELNIGKQIALWEILVGLGVVTNKIKDS